MNSKYTIKFINTFLPVRLCPSVLMCFSMRRSFRCVFKRSLWISSYFSDMYTRCVWKVSNLRFYLHARALDWPLRGMSLTSSLPHELPECCSYRPDALGRAQRVFMSYVLFPFVAFVYSSKWQKEQINEFASSFALISARVVRRRVKWYRRPLWTKVWA